jgi:hypothetical protein
MEQMGGGDMLFSFGSKGGMTDCIILGGLSRRRCD